MAKRINIRLRAQPSSLFAITRVTFPLKYTQLRTAKVHTAYIAEVKRDLGLPMYDAPNTVEELKRPRSHPTAEMLETIKDALKHFEII